MKFFARLVSLALWAVLPAVGAGLDVAEYQENRVFETLLSR